MFEHLHEVTDKSRFLNFGDVDLYRSENGAFLLVVRNDNGAYTATLGIFAWIDERAFEDESYRQYDDENCNMIFRKIAEAKASTLEDVQSRLMFQYVMGTLVYKLIGRVTNR